MFSNRTILILYAVCSMILWYEFLYYRLPLTSGPSVSLNEDRRLALKLTVNAINKPENIIRWGMHTEHLHHVPVLKMRWMLAKLLPCLSKIKIRNCTVGKKEKAQAWVFPYRWGAPTVWINGLMWDDLEKRVKARALIHECTHLVLNTLDYAYIHEEEKYNGLRGKNATYNADSITELIDIINYI